MGDDSISMGGRFHKRSLLMCSAFQCCTVIWGGALTSLTFWLDPFSFGASERSNRYMCMLCIQPLFNARPPADLKWKFVRKSFSYFSLEQQLCEAKRLGEFPSTAPAAAAASFRTAIVLLWMWVCRRKWLRKWARKIVHTTGNLEKFRCILRQLQTDLPRAPFPISRLAAATARGYD